MQNFADFWNKLFMNVPDVIIALLVLILAFVVAWIAKALITKLMKGIGLEKGLQKSGVDQKNVSKTTRFVGQLAYLVVFVLFLPGIFEKLGLNNVATPIVSMMNGFMVYLPNLIAALIIMIIGLFIAKIVKELLVPIFAKIKLNSWLQKIGINTEKVSVADILATVAYVAIVILFTVEAFSTLQLDILTRIGNQVIDYLPLALSAVIVLLAAFLLGSWVESGLVKKFKTSNFTGLAAKVGIITIGVFMALHQLGVASTLVDSAFIIILGSVAVAFAIAFGTGGKDFAARTMTKFERKLDSKNRK